MKKSFSMCLSLMCSVLLSSTSYAVHGYSGEYCVRIYCKKDMKTKLRNEKTHGRFFAAYYDWKRHIYLLDHIDWLDVLEKCGSNKSEFPGTDVDELETTAPWIRVMSAPEGRVVLDNRDCKSLERQ